MKEVRAGAALHVTTGSDVMTSSFRLSGRRRCSRQLDGEAAAFHFRNIALSRT